MNKSSLILTKIRKDYIALNFPEYSRLPWTLRDVNSFNSNNTFQLSLTSEAPFLCAESSFATTTNV